MNLAIASGKGGTGKTTLAVNLAGLMAESDNVILTDLDVEEPNLGLFLKRKLIHQEDTFSHVPVWEKDLCDHCGLCQKVCNFHAIIKIPSEIMIFSELCHGCHACSELCPKNALPMVPHKIGELRHLESDRFSFIEGRLDVGQEQAVPVIHKTMNYVRENFPANSLKIFDSPPGTSCPVVAVTKAMDFVILVTEPTPFGLHDLTLAVDVMRKLGRDIGVVINRYGIGNDDVLTYCEQESIPVLAKLPNDRKIAELYSRGELIYKKIPEFAKELAKVKEHISLLRESVET